ncbi:major capsid protein [Listeria fleischmannii FSL S10-1203]|uniref:Major capsid protein n=1 Tax=Listeria fleischmannii FSL S10-1203 TaxID=1265822 RepID=W7DYP3_9LIST|nr:major capsid protein [Listeria fleischmannii FSL S10-1203]
MPIISIAEHKEKENEYRNEFVNAMKNGDEEKQVESFAQLSDAMMKRIMAEARDTFNQETNDVNVLASRGHNPLTSEEKNLLQ